MRVKSDEELISIASDIESIITTFTKQSGLKYASNNGWLEVLTPFVKLDMSTREKYNCFAKIIKTYIPRCFSMRCEDDDDKIVRNF